VSAPFGLDTGSLLTEDKATCFVHIVAVIMTIIMILHIRSKYTAVGKSFLLSDVWRKLTVSPGRKEIVMFFYLYAIVEFLAIFLDSGVIPTASSIYPVSDEASAAMWELTPACSSGLPRFTRAWLQQLILA